jgi:effector-binding domain-containing protein
MELSDPAVMEISAQTIVEIRKTVAMTDLPAFYNDAMPALGAFAAKHGVEVLGPPLGITRGGPPSGNTIDIAAGLPVKSAPADEREIRSAVLPGGRAATLTLTGSYDQLPNAYSALMTWMAANGHKPGETAWEQYLSMADEGADPEKSVTQIWWLLA